MRAIQHFFDEYKNAGLNDPAVRDYLLDYFVDKIFVYDNRVILTAWYREDKKEITWGDIDCTVVKKRKRQKSSSTSGRVPPRTRTHVAKRYMSSCSILNRESKSGYLRNL